MIECLLKLLFLICGKKYGFFNKKVGQGKTSSKQLDMGFTTETEVAVWLKLLIFDTLKSLIPTNLPNGTRKITIATFWGANIWNNKASHIPYLLQISKLMKTFFKATSLQYLHSFFRDVHLCK